MANRRRIKHVKVGARCAVSIYRLPETNEFQVQQTVGGKVIGGKESGGAFETDKSAARSTAAAMVKELRKKHPACRR